MPNHHKGSPAERRALDTFVKLSRAVESVNAVLAYGLWEEGITPGQLAVLEALHHLGPLTQSALGEKLLRSAPNMTTVLANLEKEGLVTRRTVAEDRRSRQVRLTARGQRLIARVFPRHAARLTKLMTALEVSEQETLGALCKKLGLGATQTAARAVAPGPARSRR